MLEVLGIFKNVYSITILTFWALYLCVNLIMGRREFISRIMIPHPKAFMNLILIFSFLSLLDCCVIALYNNELNIIHNEYARQNAEFYNTTFNYIEYFPVVIFIVFAVVIGLLFLYLLFSYITNRRQKNPES